MQDLTPGPEISAQLVRELREKTGRGMMDCTRALQETNGDLEAAIVLLREKGMSSWDDLAGVDTWADGFYREDEVLAPLERCDPSSVFDWMNRSLPDAGSKVDWDHAPGEHLHWAVGHDEACLEQVVVELSELLGDQGDVIWAADGPTRHGIRFPASGLRRVASSLLVLQYHHYFLAADASWLLCFSMEGDVDLLRF